MTETVRKPDWTWANSIWFWPLVILISALTISLFAFTGVPSPVRSLVTLGFVLVCPGMAFVRFLQIKDHLNELLLGFAVSIGISAVLTIAMVTTARWSPSAGLAILIYLSVAGALFQIATIHKFTPRHLALALGTIQSHRIRLYFGFVLAGLILAALSTASMSWDGSFQFFKALDTQAIYVPFRRYITAPAHTITIIASQLGHDMGFLQVVYGLVYILFPLVSLMLSWWIVRRRAPSLFVWVALGVSISILPVQLPLFLEATIVIHLFWPVLMVILTRIQNRHIPILLLFPIIMIATHPTAALMLALAVAAMFLVGLIDQRSRRKMWFWAAIYALSGGFAIFRLSQGIGDYEAGVLSVDFFVNSFQIIMESSPVLAVVLMWVAGGMLLARPLLSRIQRWQWIQAIYSVQFLLIATAGILFLFWASAPQHWVAGFGYRHWVTGVFTTIHGRSHR